MPICPQIPSTGNIQETRSLRDRAFLSLKHMMDAEDEQGFEDKKLAFYQDWEQFPELISYFDREWLPKKEKWSLAWRRVTFCNIIFLKICIWSYLSS